MKRFSNRKGSRNNLGIAIVDQLCLRDSVLQIYLTEFAQIFLIPPIKNTLITLSRSEQTKIINFTPLKDFTTTRSQYYVQQNARINKCLHLGFIHQQLPQSFSNVRLPSPNIGMVCTDFMLEFQMSSSYVVASKLSRNYFIFKKYKTV